MKVYALLLILSFSANAAESFELTGRCSGQTLKKEALKVLVFRDSGNLNNGLIVVDIADTFSETAYTRIANDESSGGLRIFKNRLNMNVTLIDEDANRTTMSLQGKPITERNGVECWGTNQKYLE